MLPSESDLCKHNSDFNLKKFIDEIQLSSNSHLFISIPDFHMVLDDLGYYKISENLGYKKIVSCLNIIFNKFKPDNFDHIIIFSDHGFKYRSEINYAKTFNNLYLFNEDRSNCFLFHRQKKQKFLEFENKLISLADMQKIYINILEKKEIRKNLKERNYVCYEDHLDFKYSNFMQTEIFSLVNKNLTYIRSFNKALTLDRSGKFISNSISDELDSILKLETTFAKKLEYFNKLPTQQGLVMELNYYSDGSKRYIKSNYFLLKLKSVIKKIIKRIFLLL